MTSLLVFLNPRSITRAAAGFFLILLLTGAALTPVPVSEASPPAQVPSAPARSADGSYYITEPGFYSGYHFDCPGISLTSYCVKIWTEGGVHLDNFWVTTNGNAIQADSNTTFTNGEIWAFGGLSANSESRITIDTVRFNVTRGAIGFQDTAGGCEGLSAKRSYGHVIRNSTFINQTGNETVWIKCSQSVSIMYNWFSTGGQWSLSLPDSLDVEVNRNVFNVNGGANWLGIELPRSFNVWIGQNWFVGSGNSWAIWVNSGTDYLVILDNCVNGVGLLSGGVYASTVARNAAC
jgi:hypothetical protein